MRERGKEGEEGQENGRRRNKERNKGGQGEVDKQRQTIRGKG